MAVYNGEKHIKPTIESILTQTFEYFEFVIVNDCSTDATVEIINSYKDPRITLHNNDRNYGQTKSLNIGMNIARGKYIARTDAGDISLPERLEKQLAYIKVNPDIKVLGTSAFTYDKSGKVQKIVHMPMTKPSILQRCLFTTPVVHISVLMEGETIRSLGGYNEDCHITADYELWSRLLRNDFNLANMKEILVGYMISSESFGMSNALTKSIYEVPKVIQDNAKKFANMTISLEQAANIYRVFNHYIDSISLTQVINAEMTLVSILKAMRIRSNEINYLLFNKDLKCISLAKKQSTDKSILRHCLKSLLLKTNCLLSFRRFYISIAQTCQDISWRLKKRPPYVL